MLLSKVIKKEGPILFFFSFLSREITGQYYWGDIPLPVGLFAYDFCSNNKALPLKEQIGRVSHWMCGSVLHLYEMIEVLMINSEISQEKKEQQKDALMSISDQMVKRALAEFDKPHKDEFPCQFSIPGERLEKVINMMNDKFQELVVKTDGPQLLNRYALKKAKKAMGLVVVESD